MRRTIAVLAVLELVAWTGQSVSAAETLIRLSVQPMPAPKPALRYLLLPELKEMNPGNPIPVYLKASLDLNYSGDKVIVSRAALQQTDHAARLDKPDWQILPRLKSDG